MKRDWYNHQGEGIDSLAELQLGFSIWTYNHKQGGQWFYKAIFPPLFLFAQCPPMSRTCVHSRLAAVTKQCLEWKARQVLQSSVNASPPKRMFVF